MDIKDRKELLAIAISNRGEPGESKGRDNDQVMRRGTLGEIGVGRVTDGPGCLKLVPGAPRCASKKNRVK